MTSCFGRIREPKNACMIHVMPGKPRLFQSQNSINAKMHHCPRQLQMLLSALLRSIANMPERLSRNEQDSKIWVSTGLDRWDPREWIWGFAARFMLRLSCPTFRNSECTPLQQPYERSPQMTSVVPSYPQGLRRNWAGKSWAFHQLIKSLEAYCLEVFFPRCLIVLTVVLEWHIRVRFFWKLFEEHEICLFCF